MIIIINCCWILHVDKNGSSSGWVLECCVSSMCRSITVIIFTVKSWCMVVLFLCCSYNLIQLLLTTGVGWYVKTLQPEAFSKPMLNQRLHSGVCVCVCVGTRLWCMHDIARASVWWAAFVQFVSVCRYNVPPIHETNPNRSGVIWPIKLHSYQHSGQTDCMHRCCYDCNEHSQFIYDNAESIFLLILYASTLGSPSLF